MECVWRRRARYRARHETAVRTKQMARSAGPFSRARQDSNLYLLLAERSRIDWDEIPAERDVADARDPRRLRARASRRRAGAPGRHRRLRRALAAWRA